MRCDTHLWHIRLCTMDRQASAEVGALLLMSRPRSSLPHASDPGLGSDKAEITSLDGGLTSSAPVCAGASYLKWKNFTNKRVQKADLGFNLRLDVFKQYRSVVKNKIINSFFYPKQRAPCRGESRSGGRRRKIQIHWRLFNLAYGLKRNYLVKMKFYLFINWVGNTKRIKTFLILFLKLLALSSIGSSNQRFSLRFVCPRNKND